MPQKTAYEMFNELVQMGNFIPATIEPSQWMVPTAYISVPTSLVFFTPPISMSSTKDTKDTKHAKLGRRFKRNTKRKE